MIRRALLPLALAPILLAGACASIGPATVPRDRADYIGAVADSWKEQTLLNIVRMRYGDAPSFVDVSSVISSYAFQGQVSANGQYATGQGAGPGWLAGVGGTAGYADKPTITYTPLAGDKFAKSLLRPIPPGAIFELIQAGFPADGVLQLTARAINGLSNRSSLGGQTRDADPDFYAVLAALRRLQLSGEVSLRLEQRNGEELSILLLSSRTSPEAQRDLDFVLKTLRVKPAEGNQISLTFGAQPQKESEIAVLSRSMLGVLLEVASGIEVPGADVARGRAAPASRREDAADPRDRPLVRIRSGPGPPGDAYAKVHYRGGDYWIGDDDIASKRNFTFLMIFFALAETGTPAAAPVLTIPAN
jgi:hypothetical protein